jgi:hypothetical protein
MKLLERVLEMVQAMEKETAHLFCGQLLKSSLRVELWMLLLAMQ